MEVYPRGKVYWISYKLNGKRIRHSLEKITGYKIRDKKVAEHIGKQKELELEKGIAGLPSDKKIDDFFKEYCEHIKVRKSPRACKNETARLKLFIDICPTYLKDINPGLIQKFLTIIAQRKKGGKRRTVNHYLKHIKTFLKYATECDYIYKNPAKRIKKLKVDRDLPRFLFEEELKTFIPLAKKSPLYSMIMTALYTGLRVSELIALRWEKIDFEKEIITIIISKGKFRVVPLNNHLKAILAPLAKKEGPCFTYKDNGYSGQPRKALSRILREAKLKKVGWHTFRKTFASHMIMQGISITKVSKWLGHSSPVITFQTYAHLAPVKDDDIDAIEF